MPIFVFYQEADGLVVGWRESPYVGDPAAEAASRGVGIVFVEVPVQPKPRHTGRVVMGVLEETPLQPLPDRRGFEGALKAIFASDPATLNRLLVKYPLFLWSLRDENWPYVQQMILAAKTAADITQAQYDAIKAWAAAAHIPVVLP